MSAPDIPPLLAKTIYGRAVELDALGSLIDDDADISVQALVGEAGIGKTRLAQWAVERARERGRVVVQGGTQLGLPEPLGVFCDAVRGARREGIEPPVDDLLAAGFSDRLLPELGGRAGDAAEQGATFEAATRYLRALAGDRGLLLVLEDLHWADASSLTLSALLARTLRGSGVALIVTFRPDEDPGAAALERFRHELHRMRARELMLGPLADDDAAAMLEELLGRRPDAEVAAELIRLSGGNPFALEELARAVVDSGWIDLATGSRGDAAAVTVPWTLAESIRARSARLAESERDLVRWAAVIGEHFDVRLLAAAAEIDERDAVARLEGCVAAGLVVEDAADAEGNRFAFRHALVHEALVQERLLAERSRRHAAVLGAAERLMGEGVEISDRELARHAVAAGDRARTVRYSHRAAAQANELGSPAEAVMHLERALEIWSTEDGAELRAEMLLECGRLRARASRGDPRAVALLEDARDAFDQLGDARATTEALSVLAGARFEAGDAQRALGEWEQAVAELRAAGPSELLPAVLAAQARALYMQHQDAAARRAADEGLELLPSAADPSQAATRVSLLTIKGMMAMITFDLETGRPLLVEAARLATDHRDDIAAARAHQMLAGNWEAVPPQEVMSHYARAVELMAQGGIDSLHAFYLAAQAGCASRMGDWATSARLADEAESMAEDGERAGVTRVLVAQTRAERAWGMGELSEAERAYELTERMAAEIDDVVHELDSRGSAGAVAFLSGDITRATELMHPFVVPVVAGEPDALNQLEMPNWLAAVEVLVASGDPHGAGIVATAVRSVTRGGPWADYADAVAASTEIAPEIVAQRVEAAAAELESDGHRLFPARMRVAASMVLAGRPDGGAAAAQLARAAHDAFAQLGSTAWCRRLENDLRSLGEPLPRRRGGGAGGLTRRELQVLELLAEGLTNRAIAQRLVISEATAIRHVANIYAKLGVNRRAAAVRVAGERGLIGAVADGHMQTRAGGEDT